MLITPLHADLLDAQSMYVLPDTLLCVPLTGSSETGAERGRTGAHPTTAST